MEEVLHFPGEVHSDYGVVDLLLKRYGSLDYIMQMDIDDYFEISELAREKDFEDRMYQQWCELLPYMSLKMLEYISFDDYFNRVTGKNVDLRPAAEIIAEIEELHRKEGNL